MSVRMVMINGREVAIEQSQIFTSVRSSDRYVARITHPDLFVLGADWSKRLVGGMSALGGVLFFCVGVLCLKDSFVGLVLAVPGALMIAFGVWLPGPRYRFDVNAGEWSSRQFGITRKRPLTQILAVQVTEGGWLSSGRHGGIRSSTGGRYFLYQLNLVLNDPAESRRFVYSYRDVDDIVQNGRQLAEFLNVPLALSDGVSAKLSPLAAFPVSNR